MADRQITTWLSKQVVFDYTAITETSAGESDYFILCLRPDERSLLLSALNFYADWLDRWRNFPSEIDRVDLIARANESLQTEMACSEDVQLIIDNLASIALSQTEIRDNIADQTDRLEAVLQDVRDNTGNINTTLAALDVEDRIDQLEAILNQVATILGAPGVIVAP